MMSEQLTRLAELVRREAGIVLSGPQLGSLGGALRRIDPDLEPADLLDGEDPIRRAVLLDHLIDEVSVNETYFMRHVDELLGLDWHRLAADATAAGRRLRVWSAACSSGEEPYTLALLAAEALGGAGAPIDVLGTDISATALARARDGVYRARSMRLVSGGDRERWFEPVDHSSTRVGDKLRAFVRFERHNLVRDPLPPAGESPFDLIVCRNVLIYFDRDTIARTVRALRQALTTHGELVLGAADRLGTHEAPPAMAGAAAGPPARPAPARSQRGQARSPQVAAPTPTPTPARPLVAVRRTEAPAASAPAPATPAASAPAPAIAAFEAGAEALGRGDATAAVHDLRRALYLDPDFAVAALQLGRAYEEAGQVSAARRAYWRALRLAEAAERPVSRLYDRVGAGDVAAACRARLSALPEN